MKEEIDGHIRRGEPDRSQNVLGVLDVDVPRDREAKEAHGLLAMDHRDETRMPRLLDRSDRGLTPRLKHPLLQERDEELRDEEEEEDRVQVEHARSMLRKSGRGEPLCGVPVTALNLRTCVCHRRPRPRVKKPSTCGTASA